MTSRPTVLKTVAWTTPTKMNQLVPHLQQRHQTNVVDYHDLDLHKCKWVSVRDNFQNEQFRASVNYMNAVNIAAWNCFHETDKTELVQIVTHLTQ